MTSVQQRRDFLRLGVTGVTAPPIAALLQQPASALNLPNVYRGGFGRARSVIVMYCWGGMSHLDTFDMKPGAGREIRGEFDPVSTTVPGVQITEHLPMIAKPMHHLAVVRSVHHRSADHRKAAYWNLTGHAPTGEDGGVTPPVLPSRKDWPGIGAQVAVAMQQDRRYQNRKRVQRVNPEDVVEAHNKSAFDWEKIRVIRKVSLSTDVLGPGHFPTGSFGRQDGYTNNGTVELIGMIGKKLFEFVKDGLLSETQAKAMLAAARKAANTK